MRRNLNNPPKKAFLATPQPKINSLEACPSDQAHAAIEKWALVLKTVSHSIKKKLAKHV